MKNKTGLLYGILAVCVIATGILVYTVINRPQVKPAPVPEESVPQDVIPTIDSSINVDLVKSTSRANTVILTAKGLAGNITNVSYELSYESQGLIKGVNSGSKPIDTVGKDTFNREVYLGTCSKNDCKPDIGVSKVSIVLEFTDSAGKKSQFTQDYTI
jgi:hypothetical protein